MKRTWILWLYDWYTDAGRSPPRWLQRRISRDPGLQRARARMAMLEEELRVQARAKWRQVETSYRDSNDRTVWRYSIVSSPSVQQRQPPPSERVAWYIQWRQPGWAIAWAAIAILACGWLLWSNVPKGRLPSAKSSVERGVSSQEPTLAQADSIRHRDLGLAASELNARWRQPTLAAQDLLARSLARTESLPSWSQRALTERCREELNAFRDQFEGATRFVAVRLPVAGLKLLLHDTQIAHPD